MHCHLASKTDTFDNVLSLLHILIEKKNFLIEGSIVIVAVGKRIACNGTSSNFFVATAPFAFDAADAIGRFCHVAQK